jgi:hypothetical protein
MGFVVTFADDLKEPEVHLLEINAGPPLAAVAPGEKIATPVAPEH